VLVPCCITSANITCRVENLQHIFLLCQTVFFWLFWIIPITPVLLLYFLRRLDVMFGASQYPLLLAVYIPVALVFRPSLLCLAWATISFLSALLGFRALDFRSLALLQTYHSCPSLLLSTSPKRLLQNSVSKTFCFWLRDSQQGLGQASLPASHLGPLIDCT
jgi:hypothetical protein